MSSNVVTTARFITLVESSSHSYSHSNVEGKLLTEWRHRKLRERKSLALRTD